MSSKTAEQLNKTHSKVKKALNKKKVFDPRILEDNDSDKRVWTSESVEMAFQGIRDGYKLKEYPYLKSVKGALLRKADLPFKYSEEELDIIDAVIEDKEFFCENFGKLKDGDKGWTNIKLRDYQKNLLKRYDTEKWNLIMFPRQSGKTTTTILEIVHYAITNYDKDIVVIAQSDKVINEILSKLKEAFQALPIFLSPGFISFNKKGFTLDNGCRLTIGIASESVVQGYSLDFLYIDEFAYIKPSMVKKFWENIYPTLINNPKSKCIITSTPNGRNMFYQLWVGAETGLNRFTPYRIRWYDVPGRDDQFKIDTIANVGIEGWEMGFECSFDTQLKSVFSSKIQKLLRHSQQKHEKSWSTENDPLGSKYDIEFINKKKISYNIGNDYFIVGIDLAEGLEQDSTILKLKKIEWDIDKKKLVYKTVGVFRSNNISVEDFAEHSVEFFKHFDPSKIKVVVENNTFGPEYFSHIKALKLYDPDYDYINMEIFAQFRRNSKNDFELGVRWNSHNKRLAVKSFTNLIGKGIFKETHNLSIEEYLNFGRQKNDTYAAQYGHDDLVMSDIVIAHYVRTKNIYTVAFLKDVETQLRIICFDEDPEVVRKREEAKRKANNVFTHNGFKLRNHVEEVKKNELDDILMFDI